MLFMEHANRKSLLSSVKNCHHARRLHQALRTPLLQYTTVGGGTRYSYKPLLDLCESLLDLCGLLLGLCGPLFNRCVPLFDLCRPLLLISLNEPLKTFAHTSPDVRRSLLDVYVHEESTTTVLVRSLNAFESCDNSSDRPKSAGDRTSQQSKAQNRA